MQKYVSPFHPRVERKTNKREKIKKNKVFSPECTRIQLSQNVKKVKFFCLNQYNKQRTRLDISNFTSKKKWSVYSKVPHPPMEQRWVLSQRADAKYYFANSQVAEQLFNKFWKYQKLHKILQKFSVFEDFKLLSSEKGKKSHERKNNNWWKNFENALIFSYNVINIIQ